MAQKMFRFIGWCKVSFFLIPIISGEILNPLHIYEHALKQTQPHHTLSSFGFASLEDQFHSNKDGFKDLDWRENVEEYLDFTQEPSCEQLYEMWRLVKAFQSLPENSKHIMPTSIKPLLQMQTKYAGPFNYGNLGDSPQSYYKQTRRRTPSNIVGATKERSVYEKIISKNRFHANSSNEETEQNSQTNPEEIPSTRKYQSLVLSNARGERLAVRDPAKEIFGYLQLRQDGHLASPITEVDSKGHNPQQIVLGKESNGDNDYKDMQHFDEVTRNLGPNLKAKTLVSQPPTYGIIKYEEQRQPKSPFDKVRALVARNRAKEHQNLLAEGQKNDRGSPSLIEVHSIFKNPFDLIRKKLQHMPAIQPEGAMKSIRRRRSKSRQQKVQSVLSANQSLQKKPREYHWSWQ